MQNGSWSYTIIYVEINEIILNGFKAASIIEAVESANRVLERIESPFSEQ